MVKHWDRVNNTGLSEKEFLKEIKRLPKGQLWRHNQAGDLPHTNGVIDLKFLTRLISANKRKFGFTYTHHQLNGLNLRGIKYANANGFTINVSTDNVTDGIKAFTQKLPTVTVLPIDAPNDQTIDGVRVIACPAEKSERIQCSNCALCQNADRGYIIGFRAHGTKARAVDIIARSN